MLLLHGSGKTAVLVERIINKIINEDIDIDRLLVVTFTNSAASEMKERILDAIYKKIEEKPENTSLQKQITLLNKASICTIDSFCLEVVRNNFYELENISPNFRIGDTTEIELLKQEIIEELFEKKYEENDEDFTKLINTYTTYKDDAPLKELILKIYSYIQSNPFPEKWLKEKVEMFNLVDKIDADFSKTVWGKILLEEVDDQLIDCITMLEEVENSLQYDSELEKFLQTIQDDIEKIKMLRDTLDNWDKSYEVYKNLKFVTWPRKKIDSDIKDNAKIVRDDVKKKITNKLDKILISDSKEANQDIYDMHDNLVRLEKIILDFSKEFSKRKREKNIVDFNDIEHFALDILLKENEDGMIQKTEVAKRYQEKYQEIAIDEYQDSNLVQEYILTAVSKENNIFMVGDVKQSIYKFRQAMPELFLNKYESYKNKENKKDDKDNLKIQLFKNFRSRSNVLEFTNIIFENIMSNVLGDINYNKEEYLNLGATYEKVDQDLKTEIDIINIKDLEEDNYNDNNYDNDSDRDNGNDEKDEERIEDLELEARFVANRIKELIDSKFQVWDRKKNSFRDIMYKDIVVLLRATSVAAPIFEQEILNLEMPVFSDSSQEYLESIEIQTIMSLLKIIDNPMQDIPLVTVLRSNIGKFTDDELVKIRLSDKYDNFYTCLLKAKVDVDNELKQKIQNFIDSLDKWREEQEYLALDELIWKIYSDTGYYNYVGLMPNGELRQANLKMLFERAKQYETASFKGLYNFINFIEKLRLSSGDLGAAKLIGENENVIRIMSIHKSKGLEFPVVFLSNTGKQFNLMDLNNNILLHQDIGIGVKYINYEKQVQYDTLSKAAIRNKVLTETLSEEMRILYVALTRAKEKLIITGISKDYEKENDKIEQQVKQYSKSNNKINPILIKKYKRYIDWIMLVYLYEKENVNDLITLNVLNKKDIINRFKSIEIKQDSVDGNIASILDSKDISKEDMDKIRDIINFEYKYQLATTMPTKTSVTEIKKMKNDAIEIENIENIEKEVINKTIEVKEQKEQQEKEDDKDINTTFPVPNFVRKDEDEIITGARKGTLVHLCMQRLDEKQEYDLNKIKQLIEDLTNKGIITRKRSGKH